MLVEKLMTVATTALYAIGATAEVVHVIRIVKLIVNTWARHITFFEDLS